MSRMDRDATRIVESWLEDGVDRIPDRVLDAVEEQLSTTRQRRGWLGGLVPVVSAAQLSVAAGVGLLIAIAASLVGGVDVAVPPAPSATASPSPTPVPPGTVPLPFSGEIPAGAYFLAEASPAAVITIEGAWTVFPDYAGDVCRGNCDPPAGGGIGVWTVIDVYADPCRPQDGRRQPGLGPTVDDLVEALVAQQPEAPPVVTDVVVDGYPGRRLSLVAPTDLDACNQGLLWRWIGSDGSPRHGLPGERDEIWVLDVDGHRVVLDVLHFAGTPARDLDALLRAAESLHFYP